MNETIVYYQIASGKDPQMEKTGWPNPFYGLDRGEDLGQYFGRV